jgi:hypothetical protein
VFGGSARHLKDVLGSRGSEGVPARGRDAIRRHRDHRGVLITVEKTWRRWCGPRSELVRATELAAEVLRGWTGVESTVSVRIEERGGLAETASGVDAINAPHERELAHVDRLVVTIVPDRDEWWKERDEARERGEERPYLPDAGVSIRISKYGTSLSVEGDDRTSVEGLVQRLAQILGRAATKSPGVDREFFVYLLIWPLAMAGLVLGPDRRPLARPCRTERPMGCRGDRRARRRVSTRRGGRGRALVDLPARRAIRRGRRGSRPALPRSGIAAVGTLIFAVVGSFIYDQVK